MPAREHRRVANQPTNQPRPAHSVAEWEQLRRALLMIVAQFRETDAEGCYTLEVRVILRDRAAIPMTPTPTD